MIGVGCAAHIVHSALEAGCDALSVDIEWIVVKIYSHFYIYTVRVEALKSICASEDIDFKKLLGYAKTRFLAMGPAIDRILNIYDALKRYFLEIPGKKEILIKSFFREPSSMLWLLFAREQVSSKYPLFYRPS